MIKRVLPLRKTLCRARLAAEIAALPPIDGAVPWLEALSR